MKRQPLLQNWMILLTIVLLAACSSTSQRGNGLNNANSPSVRGYKVGKPYQVRGVWYYPAVDYEYSEVGVASWYGPGFDGRPTANGELYDMNDLTAAHRTLPMPSIVRVTNLENGRSIKLRVNDRGPFVGARIIDVSRRAAQLLGFHINGTAQVLVEIVADESKQLAAALGVPVDIAVAEHPTEPATLEVAAAYAATASTVSPPEPEPEPEPGTGEVALESMPVGSLQETSEAPVSEAEPSPPTVGRVADESGPVPQRRAGSTMYVQAGAFADFNRADVARRRLSRIGPIVTSRSRINGRELMRIRVGPLQSDGEAQRVLASVSRAGFPDCHVVIE